MNGFTIVELSRPGLLRRLVGGKPRENAFAEIQNLLATRPLSDLAAADIINILSAYQIPREDAMPTLIGFYEQVIRYYAHDATISGEERQGLKQLRYVLDLDDAAANDAEGAVLRGKLRDQLKRALTDSHLSDEEKQSLEATAASFGLDQDAKKQIYTEEILAVMQAAFNKATADRRLTQEEEAHLAKMGGNLGITITHDATTQRTIERFRLLARIDAGELPVLNAPIMLQRGEVCHAELPCALHELRTITKRINYSGPSGRIRIMKGLSWRYGSVGVRRVTAEELRKLDSGVLYVTNKRLLFNGAARNVATALKKVIHFTVHKDGIQIEKDTGRDQYFIGSGDLELVSEVLETALRISR